MEEKKIKWHILAFMCFSTLWGFGNVVNGFIFFNGTQVIFSWVLMFLLYFIPYALMVGEMGSAFKTLEGGVTSWIQETSSTKLAYYTGWTYWACHVTYIASKGSGGLKALSWIVFQDSTLYDSLPTVWVQLVTLIIFLFFCWIASMGINPLKNLATLAGSSMFVMSILFILMMFAAPAINPNGGYLNIDWSLKNFIPNFDWHYFTNLSILVFAVGGIEKISPYVNKMDGDPAHEFPKSMIFAAVMVVISAIFGTIAMGMMLDPAVINESPQAFDSYLANGAYIAFGKLGEYYGVGKLFMIIYALCNMIGQFATLVISIDAPLRMLLGDPRTSQFIPRSLLKQNRHGAYINGIYMVVVLCGAIIVAQMVVPGAATVLKQLTKLNSIIMPFRYLWVFAAYLFLRQQSDKFHREYMFVKNNTVALFFGGWCFLVTLACCLLGAYSDDPFQLALNIITPIVLILLGIILPVLRRREDEKLQAGEI